MFLISTIFLALLSLLGYYYNIKQNPLGFIIWGFTNTTWAIIDFSRGIYVQAVLFVIYLIISIYGYKSWKKQRNLGNIK